MTKDASYNFPTSTSSSLALRPQEVNPNSNNNNNINLNLGPLSLNVAGGAGNALEAGVDAARDGLRGFFGKVRDALWGTCFWSKVEFKFEFELVFFI